MHVHKINTSQGINNNYLMHEVTFRNLWRKKVHAIADAGHAVHMEKPQEFNAILKDFFIDMFKGEKWQN